MLALHARSQRAPPAAPRLRLRRHATRPQLRSGQVIERDGRLLVVVEAKHTQGQGRASGFVQLEARDVRSGTKYVERLSPSDRVERVTMERVDYTYLFSEGKNVVLMDPTTFEQARLWAQRAESACLPCSRALPPRRGC